LKCPSLLGGEDEVNERSRHDSGEAKVRGFLSQKGEEKKGKAGGSKPMVKKEGVEGNNRMRGSSQGVGREKRKSPFIF